MVRMPSSSGSSLRTYCKLSQVKPVTSHWRSMVIWRQGFCLLASNLRSDSLVLTLPSQKRGSPVFMSFCWKDSGLQPITVPRTLAPSLGHLAATDAPPSMNSSAPLAVACAIRAGAAKGLIPAILIFRFSGFPILRFVERLYLTAGRIRVLHGSEPVLHDLCELVEIRPGLVLLLLGFHGGDLGLGLMEDLGSFRFRSDGIRPLGQGGPVLWLRLRLA